VPAELTVRRSEWPLARPFAIARGTKTHAAVIEVELAAEGEVGRGECVPYARYGQSVEAELATLEGLREALRAGLTRHDLMDLLPAGPARNALDCALWDLEAKLRGLPVWQLAGLSEPSSRVTALTLSIAEPELMCAQAREVADRALLKLKLAGDGSDLERVSAVRAGAPDSALWVDANEGLDVAQLTALADPLAELGVVLVEQPLHADNDGALAGLQLPVALCADESFIGVADGIDVLLGRYQAVNVKLDKAGGLTEALLVCETARKHGLDITVGCMCSTSLSLAPAFLLTPLARYVDLDAGYLLAADREHGLRYDRSRAHPPVRELWG